MTGGPTYAQVMREVYGTADAATFEAYGGPRPRKRRPSLSQPSATNHARLLHSCGHYVYTEQHGKRPAAFPLVCWYCGGSTTLSPGGEKGGAA